MQDKSCLAGKKLPVLVVPDPYGLKEGYAENQCKTPV